MSLRCIRDVLERNIEASFVHRLLTVEGRVHKSQHQLSFESTRVFPARIFRTNHKTITLCEKILEKQMVVYDMRPYKRTSTGTTLLVVSFHYGRSKSITYSESFSPV
jgi:hypothetical protein